MDVVWSVRACLSNEYMGISARFLQSRGHQLWPGADAASEHLPCLEITQPFYEDVEI
jgi:hypothetical protein